MARLWAKTANFDSISVGDQLPVLIKWDTAQSINRFLTLSHESQESDKAPGDGLVPRQAVVAYITELLGKGFPIDGVKAKGSRLDVSITGPIKPDDTISYTGEVVAKREENGLRLVECSIVAENQENQVVARAVAVVALG